MVRRIPSLVLMIRPLVVAAILARRGRWRTSGTFLILGVVRVVNPAKHDFSNLRNRLALFAMHDEEIYPKLSREIHGRIGPLHLILLDLET